MPVPITSTRRDSRSGRDLDVRVEGPGACGVDDADLRRLFPGNTLTASRRARLRAWPRVVVTLDGDLVAVATCQHVVCDMCVPDLAIAIPPSRIAFSEGVTDDRVLHAVLDAIEVMSLAGGCRRIVLHPPRVATGTLERRGYVPVENKACARGWLQKAIA